MSSRFFENLTEATEEIRRDLAKGIRIDFTRVQQRTGEHLPGRERTGYEYTVLNGIPTDPEELIFFGQTHGFPLYQTKPDRDAMAEWLFLETNQRLWPMSYNPNDPALEKLHPALRSTLEGNWPSYLYRERMVGAVEMMAKTLAGSSDTRRAYWPIFQPVDSFRASAPTRIPCSLGYQLMLRQQNNRVLLLMTYLQRSADFDHFWLSDVFLAHQFQLRVSAQLNVECGSFTHYILSFHSFKVEGSEIY